MRSHSAGTAALRCLGRANGGCLLQRGRQRVVDDGGGFCNTYASPPVFAYLAHRRRALAIQATPSIRATTPSRIFPLTTPAARRYNAAPTDGQVAQSVEQGIENPRVGGSIPSLTTSLPVPRAFAPHSKRTLGFWHHASWLTRRATAQRDGRTLRSRARPTQPPSGGGPAPSSPRSHNPEPNSRGLDAAGAARRNTLASAPSAS